MRTFLVSVFVVFLSACGADNNSSLSFDLESFKPQAMNYADAEKIAPEGLLLGRPTSLRFHPDGFLVIGDYLSEKQVSIVDLRDGSWEQFASKGRGPMELLGIRNVSTRNGDVWMSSPMESKVVRLAFDRSARKFDAAEEFDLSATRFMRALPFADSEFLIMGQRSEYRMEIVSDRGDSIRAVGSFPEVKVAPGVKINNGLVQSIVTIAPDGRHTAVACMSVDYIDIYDENMELAKRLRGPMDVQPEFMMKELPGSGGMFALTQEPRFDVFRTCASTDKGFFVAYNGIEIKTPEDLQKEATRILSFDWNGKPLRCYTFDHPVWCFDVDAAAEKLYVATQNNESLEPEILIYNL